MNILIVGAGEIGKYLAHQLSSDEHSLCVIDRSLATVTELNETMDVRAIHGEGTSVTVLEEAMIADCDLCLVLTADDATNLSTASIAKQLGAAQTIARVSTALQREEWLFNYRGHFAVDYLFSPDRLAAIELAKYIRHPDSLLVEEIARGKIELQQVQVSSHSVAAGKTLQEIGLPPRLRIGLIQRNAELLVPLASEVLQAGDMVTVFGEPRQLSKVIKMLQPAFAKDRKANVIIAGGTECGVALAEMLEGVDADVRLFDPDPILCARLASHLHNTTVLCADGTSLHALREEQAGNADFLVAAAVDDADNVMACLQAHHLGIRHSLALIHRSEYAHAISRSGPRLGILGAVSPREATLRDIMRFVTKDGYRPLISLEGDVEVLEVPVTADSHIANRQVKDVDWPQGSGLVALLHGNSAMVPAATDTIAAGDTLYAMVSASSRVEFLRKVLAR